MTFFNSWKITLKKQWNIVIAITINIFLSMASSKLPSPLSSKFTNIYNPKFAGPSPSWDSDIMIKHAEYLIRSFHNATKGKELIPQGISILNKDPFEAAKLLYYLPDRVVVSHGLQNINNEGPILNYGNQAALARWETSYMLLTQMPSKYTAEPMLQSERAEFLNRVLTNGYIDNYVGIRITSKQNRFKMLDGCVWNVNMDIKKQVYDCEDIYDINDDVDKEMIKKIENNIIRVGQAATFSKWLDL